jgi:catechol 2,3-dioxygenase-like lactoylglutathione lyase family enzyme
MQIDRLELIAPDLAALRDFYVGRFGLTALPSPPARLELQVGTTRLVFTQAPEGWNGRYHFAFNIPENGYREAKAWLAARVPLAAAADGRDEFWSDDWNADILYFFDPAGNIGELIARHTLDCASDAPFGPASLLAVSEIGLATPDVPATVADLSTRLGIFPYGETSDTFAPVGDERGLFIVVCAGRISFPDTGILAEPVPITATIRNPQSDAYRVEVTTTGLTTNALAP